MNCGWNIAVPAASRSVIALCDEDCEAQAHENHRNGGTCVDSTLDVAADGIHGHADVEAADKRHSDGIPHLH